VCVCVCVCLCVCVCVLIFQTQSDLCMYYVHYVKIIPCRIYVLYYMFENLFFMVENCKKATSCCRTIIISDNLVLQLNRCF
jgi:hypothetical protein